MEFEAPWYVALRAACKLNRPFTAPDLARVLSLKGVEGVKIASRWIYKFRRWGYIEVRGTQKGAGIRPLNVCVVTEKGKACRPRMGRGAQIDRLLHSVAALKKVRGTRGERSAMDQLFKVADEIGG